MLNHCVPLTLFVWIDGSKCVKMYAPSYDGHSAAMGKAAKWWQRRAREGGAHGDVESLRTTDSLDVGHLLISLRRH